MLTDPSFQKNSSGDQRAEIFAEWKDSRKTISFLKAFKKQIEEETDRLVINDNIIPVIFASLGFLIALAVIGSHIAWLVKLDANKDRIESLLDNISLNITSFPSFVKKTCSAFYIRGSMNLGCEDLRFSAVPNECLELCSDAMIPILIQYGAGKFYYCDSLWRWFAWSQVSRSFNSGR